MCIALFQVCAPVRLPALFVHLYKRLFGYDLSSSSPQVVATAHTESRDRRVSNYFRSSGTTENLVEEYAWEMSTQLTRSSLEIIGSFPMVLCVIVYSCRAEAAASMLGQTSSYPLPP